MIGLVRDLKVAILWFLAMFSISVASGCLLLALSASLDFYLAIQIYLITSAFSTLVTGFFINLNDIPWVFRWLKYVSIPRYTFESTVINEAVNTVDCFPQARQDFIRDWLVLEKFDYGTYWMNIGIQFLLIAVFLGVAFYGLKVKARKK